MKISIVTPAFNSAQTIADTIRSVKSQHYTDIEYIIVDGGSNDGTHEIVEAHADVVDIFISEKDNGIYHAMNKGIRAASGDVIAILNSDDFYVNPYVIDRVMACFIKNKRLQSVYGDLQYVDKDDTTQIVRHWESGAYKRKRFLAGWMPPHPAFFVRRSAYENYGQFNERLRNSADYELMLRFLYKNGISTYYVPEVLVRMRTGGASNAGLKSRWRANREDRLAWQINGLRPRFYTIPLKPLRKLGQYFLRPSTQTPPSIPTKPSTAVPIG
jgi:glycosyltransferase involved in cell wall biosynthesis